LYHCSVFVGREDALAAADAAFAGIRSGHGRVLLVAGEAGIGKTTLAQEIHHRAEAAGMAARWGACFEGSELLPFGVWIDCLRYPPTDDACAAVAARLDGDDPGVGANAVDAATAQRQRLRLFREVVQALRAASVRQPQAVVLDDLHWADAGSLDLLRAVAAAVPALPVLVVATYRHDELDPPQSLAALGGQAERIMLEGFPQDEVASLLANSLGREPSADEVRRVHHQTGGNPLFITQLARLSLTTPATGIPTALRDVLARRLARVSSSCARVLGVAAVIGSDFDQETLIAVLDEPPDAIAGALEEAAVARLVVRRDQPDRWQFVHNLVRAARYEDLGPQARQAWHRRACEVLAAESASPGVLAQHAALAGFDREDVRPACYEAEAAHEALRRMAWTEAAVLAERALQSAPPGPQGDAIKADAWLTLGNTQLRTGDDRAAAEAFGAAADIGRLRAQPELIARAALGFGAGLAGFEVTLHDRRQVDLLEEAAAQLAEDAALRPLVLARLSIALAFLGSEARRLALADEAIARARQRGDERALAASLGARCDAVSGPDHIDERLIAANEIIGLAQKAGDIPLELLGRRLRAVALLEQRDLISFDAEVDIYARAAERLGDPFYGWYPDMWRAMRAHANGHLDEAERLAERAASLGESAGSHNAPLLRSVLMVFMSLDRGDEVSATRHWREVIAWNPEVFGDYSAPVTALIHGHFGRTDSAHAALDRFGPTRLDALPKNQEWLSTVGESVLAAARIGRQDIARHAYGMLIPYEGVGLFEGIAAMDYGVVDRLLALAAGCCGDGEAALRHTERALAGVADAGALVTAHTRADCARALFATDDETASQHATDLALRAVEEYEALGLTELAEQLRAVIPDGDAGALAGPVPDASTPASLMRDGDTWAFTFEDATVRVRHAKGIADLAVLLSQPGREVHVRALEGLEGTGVAAAQSSQPRLDDAAVASYRQRLHDLEEELDEAERHADAGRASRLAAERDALVDELTKAFGLGGRRRSAGTDPDERLRKAVSARVKASIDRVETLHTSLGRHLRRSVRTGYWCCYEPERPTTWAVVR
jgi:hypothetical protein